MINKVPKGWNMVNTKPNVKSNSNFFTSVLNHHKSCHFEGFSPKNLLLQGWFCISWER